MNYVRFALCAAVLCLTACGGGGGQPSPGPAAPAVVLNATEQANFIAGQLSDDFERSDRPLDGDSLLPTSPLRWNVTGRGQATAAIVDGRLEASDQIFAYIDYEAPVTRIAGVFSFASAGATDDPTIAQMGLIADRRTADEGLQNILHLNFGPRSWTLYKGRLEPCCGSPRVAIASGTHSLQIDGTPYGIALEITAGAVTVIAPNGERVTVAADVNAAPAGGGAGTTGPLQFAAFQITAAAGAPKGRWEAVARNR